MSANRIFAILANGSLCLCHTIAFRRLRCKYDSLSPRAIIFLCRKKKTRCYFDSLLRNDASQFSCGLSIFGLGHLNWTLPGQCERENLARITSLAPSQCQVAFWLLRSFRLLQQSTCIKRAVPCAAIDGERFTQRVSSATPDVTGYSTRWLLLQYMFLNTRDRLAYHKCELRCSALL